MEHHEHVDRAIVRTVVKAGGEGTRCELRRLTGCGTG